MPVFVHIATHVPRGESLWGRLVQELGTPALWPDLGNRLALHRELRGAGEEPTPVNVGHAARQRIDAAGVLVVRGRRHLPGQSAHRPSRRARPRSHSPRRRGIPHA